MVDAAALVGNGRVEAATSAAAHSSAARTPFLGEHARRPPRAFSAAMSSDGAVVLAAAKGDDAKVKRLLKAKWT